MGNVHARQYRKRSDVELFLYDHTPARAQKFSDTWQVEALDSFEALAARVDVLDICLPTPVHLEIGLKAVAAGKPIFMEKPLARTLAEGVQLANAATKAGVLLTPGHVVRFFPEYAAAKSMVASGRLGKPAAARARRGGGAPSGDQGWFMDHTKSGGILLDLSIHDFDWLRWTLGEVSFLTSRSLGINQMSGPDYALTTMTFDNGCVAHVEGTWMDPGGFRTTFEICGSEGMIQHDSRTNQALRTTVAQAPGEGAPLPAYEGNLGPSDDPYYKEIDAFLSAVSGATPAVTAVDGLKALSIADAAIESAKTGKTVKPAREF
jgi:predicted dehydrogenase